MKNHDKRSTLLLSSIIVCLILGIIIYPSLKLSNKNKEKEEFRGEVSNIVLEAEKYYLDKASLISLTALFISCALIPAKQSLRQLFSSVSIARIPNKASFLYKLPQNLLLLNLTSTVSKDSYNVIVISEKVFCNSSIKI